MPVTLRQSLSPTARARLDREQLALVRGVVLALGVSATLHGLIALAFSSFDSRWELALHPVFLLSLTVAWFAARAERTRLAAGITIGAFYLAVVSYTVLVGRVEPGAVLAFVDLALLAGFTLGSTTALGTALLTGLTLLTLVQLEYVGLLVGVRTERATPSVVTFFVGAFALSGALVSIGLWRLYRALDRASLREHEAQRALDELTLSRAENELQAQQGAELARLAEQLVKERDVVRLGGSVLEALRDVLPSPGAAILRLDDPPRVEQAAGSAVGEVAPAALRRVSAQLVETDAVLLEHQEERAAVLEVLRAPGWVSCAIVAPVPVRGERVVLVAAAGNEANERDVAFTRVLANMLGAARARALVEAELRHVQKVEAIGQLAGGVAHDFNNLLTTIMGSAQLVQHRLGARGVEASLLGDIVRAGEHAAMLTRQLLTFSRQRAEAQESQDLREFVLELEGLLRRVAGEHMELTVEPGSESLPVLADRVHLEQILFNLVANAGSATELAGRVLLKVRRDEDSVVLTVEDDGPGMPEDVQHRAFEPFFTTREGRGGTGLGLATVARIVEDLAGTITVNSQVGRGTVFDVRLPVSPASRRALGPVADARLSSSAALRVLLVDDDELVRGSTEAMLEFYGHDVIVAGDGLEALERLEEAAAFDLVVTDVAMPKCTGPELVRAMRERGFEHPVLFITGYSDTQLDPQLFGRSLGVLHKPFRPQELQDRVVGAVAEAVPRRAGHRAAG